MREELYTTTLEGNRVAGMSRAVSEEMTLAVYDRVIG